MSDEQQIIGDGTAAPNSRRRLIWVLGSILAVAVIATTLAFAVTPRGDAAEQTPAPTSSPDTSQTPDASPTTDTTPSATPGATPSPSASAPASENPFPELDPVEPEEPGVAEGLKASLVKFESVTGEVVGPGDVAAAAVRVTVKITNTGTKPLNLDLIVMNAYMGVQRDPAETYEQPGGDPVNGSLAAGKTATGVYLFRIPEERREDVIFVLDYRAGLPAITFRGPVP